MRFSVLSHPSATAAGYSTASPFPSFAAASPSPSASAAGSWRANHSVSSSMRRSLGSPDVVMLVRVDHELRIGALLADADVQLLGLRRRTPPVLLARGDEQRRVDLVDAATRAVEVGVAGGEKRERVAVGSPRRRRCGGRAGESVRIAAPVGGRDVQPCSVFVGRGIGLLGGERDALAVGGDRYLREPSQNQPVRGRLPTPRPPETGPPPPAWQATCRRRPSVRACP